MLQHRRSSRHHAVPPPRSSRTLHGNDHRMIRCGAAHRGRRFLRIQGNRLPARLFPETGSDFPLHRGPRHYSRILRAGSNQPQALQSLFIARYTAVFPHDFEFLWTRGSCCRIESSFSTVAGVFTALPNASWVMSVIPGLIPASSYGIGMMKQPSARPRISALAPRRLAVVGEVCFTDHE
jgi:hypothetical protein